MLWMDIDITTFPTPTLWEWVDRVKGWEGVLRAEIDRRTMEATEGTEPTDRGAPPPGGRGRRVRNPFSSDNFEP